MSLIKHKCTCGAGIEFHNADMAAVKDASIWLKNHADCMTYWRDKQSETQPSNYPRIHPHPNKLHGVSMVANGLNHADINIQFSGGESVTIPFVKEYSANDSFGQLCKLIQKDD
jgi:hypothetical protein